MGYTIRYGQVTVTCDSASDALEVAEALARMSERAKIAERFADMMIAHLNKFSDEERRRLLRQGEEVVLGLEPEAPDAK